ncbi:MarR family winged helix-turn-helix transcriptional regulator [Nakamurella endophytica]|uniref:MarR family transcriptional regulator n=1 Tax=Nakamurella endophytica TaxID=1748367 RepID=A0A917SWV1_9ACTN|nr:MarR family winged helix-turn-helix transcriptional regulator [Nakamurella endophytica]GGL99923.1 MarR family transcriptional regulator [Nakamurella endophytica]
MAADTEPLPDAPGADPPDVRWLSDDETAAWLAVVAMMLRLPAALDGRLQREAGIGLFDYLVLSSLSMVEGRTARMSDLAGLVNGSLSRLSNVVKRLEQHGWVRRAPDPDNARYTTATLTAAGWDKVVATAPGHVRSVRDLVIEPLDAQEVRQLGTFGRRIADRVLGGLAGAPLPAAGAEGAADCCTE